MGLLTVEDSPFLLDPYPLKVCTRSATSTDTQVEQKRRTYLLPDMLKQDVPDDIHQSLVKLLVVVVPDTARQVRRGLVLRGVVERGSRSLDVSHHSRDRAVYESSHQGSCTRPEVSGCYSQKQP